MLKSIRFKIQVQLIAKKRRNFLSSSTDQELGSTDRKSQAQFFCKIFKQAQALENV